MMPELETVLRIFLPVYFLAFVLIGGPLRVMLHRRRYRIDPLTVQDPDPLMEFGERYRDVLLLTVIVMSLAWAFFPEVQDRLGPIRALETPAVQVVGALLLVASLVVIVLGQEQLGRSWRFGIDRADPPEELVTDGLYAISRNPIYLGLVLAAVGLFLVLPNALTFAVPNVAWVLLGMRIRLEERFLAQVHGSAFEAWCRRTPRWLGWPSGG